MNVFRINLDSTTVAYVWNILNIYWISCKYFIFCIYSLWLHTKNNFVASSQYLFGCIQISINLIRQNCVECVIYFIFPFTLAWNFAMNIVLHYSSQQRQWEWIFLVFETKLDFIENTFLCIVYVTYLGQSCGIQITFEIFTKLIYIIYMGIIGFTFSFHYKFLWFGLVWSKQMYIWIRENKYLNRIYYL